VEYATSYGLKVTGSVVAGPKAGDVLDGVRQEIPDAESVADAVRKAESYRGMFVGVCEVYSRQYVKRKGFVVVDGLALVDVG
jgi:hypothetical protein